MSNRLPVVLILGTLAPESTRVSSTNPMTGLVSGRAGLRELLSRLLRWRVGARWYAAALLPGPLLVAAVLFALSLVSPIFLPGIVTTDDRLALLLFGLAWGLM